MNPYFETLGQTISSRWQKQNFSLTTFPELAQKTLNDNPPSKNITLDQIIHEFLTNDNQPTQGQSGFGQPEIVAFSDTRFYIQILFWMEGTTDIHQHEFSGAFHVMHGSSVHSTFEFLNAHTITPHIRTGELKLKNLEILETGRTIPITSGNNCIHSLFHLDTPSITIVVRTHHDPGTGPQLNYLPPHIATDPVHADSLTMRRKQLLDILENTDTPTFLTELTEMLDTLDFERGFSILHHTMHSLKAINQWETTLNKFQTKHQKLATGVPHTLNENYRRETISQLRYQIENPDHRFFLALLMNVQTSANIQTLIKERFPHQAPIDTIIQWAEELIELTQDSLTLLDATFPQTTEPQHHEHQDNAIDTQFTLIIETLRLSLDINNKQPPLPSHQAQIQSTLTHSCLHPLFL